MHNRITSIIGHMAKSHVEMAKIIESKRHVIVQMSQIIDYIPDYPSFSGVEIMKKNSIQVVDSINSYLNSLADLEEAVAENLTHVMQEMSEDNAEE